MSDPDLVSPYPEDDARTWLRGNLHTHTTVSDGDLPVEGALAAYEAAGYDFLAISDHDTLVDPVAYRDVTDLVLLPAVEVTANGPHLLHVGARAAVAPEADRQAVLDGIGAREGFAVLNHPSWKESYAHWSHEALTGLEGYAGIEIYNGVIERHPGAATATDRWDRLLSAGRRAWGYANDDTHRAGEVALGWNVVRVEERTPAAIREALAAGRFYGSTGVEIRSIRAADGEVAVATSDAQRIRLVSDYGVVQQTVDGTDATFRIPDQLVHGSDHTYVRVECAGRAGTAAWTQPIFLE
jgi:hypothetical protein